MQFTCMWAGGVTSIVCGRNGLVARFLWVWGSVYVHAVRSASQRIMNLNCDNCVIASYTSLDHLAIHSFPSSLSLSAKSRG